MPEAAATMENKDLNAWVHAHTAELLRFAASRVKEPEVAEDLVQLTFIAAWKGREKFEQQSSPRTWLFSILKNKIADHYRKVYRDPVVHGLEATDADFFTAEGRWRADHIPTEWDLDEQERNESMQRFLAECLKKLPAHWRAAVEMKFLKEKDAAAICQELGITATNYWQQIHRAKVKLRECISARIASNPER